MSFAAFQLSSTKFHRIRRHTIHTNPSKPTQISFALPHKIAASAVSLLKIIQIFALSCIEKEKRRRKKNKRTEFTRRETGEAVERRESARPTSRRVHRGGVQPFVAGFTANIEASRGERTEPVNLKPRTTAISRVSLLGALSTHRKQRAISPPTERATRFEFARANWNSRWLRGDW